MPIDIHPNLTRRNVPESRQQFFEAASLPAKHIPNFDHCSEIWPPKLSLQPPIH
jgi:hypothetical protein